MNVPRDVQIDFSGFAEPFSNAACHYMMEEVRILKFEQLHVYSTLMGLRPHMRDMVKRSNPNVFRVHVPDTKAFVVPDGAWINAFETFRIMEIPATYMTMGEVPPRLVEYLAHAGIKVESPDMLSRGGNLWVPRRLTGKMRCTMERWKSNVMLPNGDVYGCCMDYSLTVLLGNLLTDSYEEIESAAMQWKSNMEFRCDDTICSTCEWATQA